MEAAATRGGAQPPARTIPHAIAASAVLARAADNALATAPGSAAPMALMTSDVYTSDAIAALAAPDAALRVASCSDNRNSHATGGNAAATRATAAAAAPRSADAAVDAPAFASTERAAPSAVTHAPSSDAPASPRAPSSKWVSREWRVESSSGHAAPINCAPAAAAAAFHHTTATEPHAAAAAPAAAAAVAVAARQGTRMYLHHVAAVVNMRPGPQRRGH